MKKTIFTLSIGMIIGLSASSVTGTFAAIGDRVEAVVAEYVIKVDGVEQVLEVSPIAINDSTYVPLRAMANMMGKDVTYKADSRTIEITTPVVALEVSTMKEAVGEETYNTFEAILKDHQFLGVSPNVVYQSIKRTEHMINETPENRILEYYEIFKGENGGEQNFEEKINQDQELSETQKRIDDAKKILSGSAKKLSDQQKVVDDLKEKYSNEENEVIKKELHGSIDFQETLLKNLTEGFDYYRQLLIELEVEFK